MQYLLLLYANEEGGASLPPEEMSMWMDKMAAYGAALEKAGAFISTGGLAPTAEARTISKPDRELQIHNGPYADTQEQLGGYYLIEAASMDAAVKWAAKCPAAIWGHVEIREVSHG